MILFVVALASFVAAALNAAAGGGTFVTFPTLTGLAGLSEKVANITSTVGLWPGIAASVVAARAQLRKIHRPVLLGYAIVGLVGGLLGAALLLHTSPKAFARAVPWLLLFATVIFATGKRISRWAGRADGPSEPRFSARTIPLLLLISVYNGYFGAGAGILLIGGLSVAGLHDLKQLNALKTVIQVTANGAAVAVFAWGGVHWKIAGIMAVAATVGGFAGMAVAQRVSQVWVRGLVLLMGAGLSAAYFVKEYGWG